MGVEPDGLLELLLGADAARATALLLATVGRARVQASIAPTAHYSLHYRLQQTLQYSLQQTLQYSLQLT